MSLIPPQDFRNGQWFFEGVEVIAAGLPMTIDAFAHLLIARLRGREKKPPPAESSRQRQRQLAFAAAHAAADQNEMVVFHDTDSLPTRPERPRLYGSLS